MKKACSNRLSLIIKSRVVILFCQFIGVHYHEEFNTFISVSKKATGHDLLNFEESIKF